ncbi:MAG TPA: hypothetical protein VKY39_01970, partial [Aggregatilineales bacterium]|nr:hypothetical protein [Aggregatilineales bacterium]
KPATVRQNLKRMTDRGVIEQPAYGQYQAVMKDQKSDSASRAGEGVTPVTPVTLQPSVTGVTPVTPTPARARARVSQVDETICQGCGGKLTAMAVAAGEVRHDIC